MLASQQQRWQKSCASLVTVCSVTGVQCCVESEPTADYCMVCVANDHLGLMLFL